MASLEDFLNKCEEIISFEENLKETDSSGFNDSAIDVEKSELHSLWTEGKETLK